MYTILNKERSILNKLNDTKEKHLVQGRKLQRESGRRTPCPG